MQSKRFQRTTEDFTCESCGKPVSGNGYTNHCPYCLHSKHVDVNPGDRACECHGLMVPIAYERKGGAEVIVQRCKKCGHVRKNKVCAQDDRDAVIALSAKHG